MYKVLGVITLLLGIALLGQQWMAGDPSPSGASAGVPAPAAEAPIITTSAGVSAPAGPPARHTSQTEAAPAPWQSVSVPAAVSVAAYQSPLSAQIADLHWQCVQTTCHLRLSLLDGATMSMAAKTLQSLQQAIKEGKVPGQASVGLAGMQMGAHPKTVTYAFDTRPPAPLPPAVIQLQDALTENAALKAELERRNSPSH